jgi:hypothetical protein
MNLYQLKGIINSLQLENKESNKYLLQFYTELYQQQLQNIADQVRKELENESYFKSKTWLEYLSK